MKALHVQLVPRPVCSSLLSLEPRQRVVQRSMAAVVMSVSVLAKLPFEHRMFCHSAHRCPGRRMLLRLLTPPSYAAQEHW